MCLISRSTFLVAGYDLVSGSFCTISICLIIRSIYKDVSSSYGTIFLISRSIHLVAGYDLLSGPYGTMYLISTFIHLAARYNLTA